MQNAYSQTFLQKRKFLMVLPLLTLPFLTLVFWAMGGGGKENHTGGFNSQKGLNLQLPDAKFTKEKALDKLSFYNKAQEDFIKLRQEMRNDPYYKNGLDTLQWPQSKRVPDVETFHSNKLNPSLYQSSTDINEAKIYERLSALNKVIEQPDRAMNSESNELNDYRKSFQQTDSSGDPDHLENMMQAMNEKQAGDPELKQLQSMLDKILDIQHPERVKDKLKEKSLQQKQMVFAVSKQSFSSSIGLIDTSKKENPAQTRFYGIEQDDPAGEQNAIEAVIHGNQSLVTGAVVKLRLLNSIYVAGTLIPKESFVFGIASLNGERLEIGITTIRSGNSLYPVQLEVYDLDGLPGIYIPGAISRDIAKQSAGNSLQLMELSTMDPSLKAQAAAAGINATKNLLSKKTKLVKVMVKAGYRVLLKDQNNQQ